MQRYFETRLQIRHNSCVIYDLPTLPAVRRGNEHIIDLETYTGKVTAGSKKRIEKAVDLLLQKSPQRRIYNPVRDGYHDFRINFVTLTIADEVNRDDREVYEKCLKPFLRIARERWDVEDYIWKAELQNRGQVHYHVTTNQFIHLEELRREWNKLQKKAGYLQSYARKYKSFNPNSTDVHAVWKVKNLAGYLSKYLSKIEDKAALKGKVWDCSKSLKIKRFDTALHSGHEEILHDALSMNFAKRINLDNCVIIEFPHHQNLAEAVLTESELTRYKTHLSL